jgi:hypothetical protein
MDHGGVGTEESVTPNIKLKYEISNDKQNLPIFHNTASVNEWNRTILSSAEVWNLVRGSVLALINNNLCMFWRVVVWNKIYHTRYFKSTI